LFQESNQIKKNIDIFQFQIYFVEREENKWVQSIILCTEKEVYMMNYSFIHKEHHTSPGERIIKPFCMKDNVYYRHYY